MRRKFYCIRASVLYTGIVFTIALFFLVYYRGDLYELWKEYNGREEIKYVGMKSELEDQDRCYLCGNNGKSLVEYYRKESTIGIIALNNWYVTDFKIEKKQDEINSGTPSVLTNVEGISINSEGTPDRGMASIEVDLSENYQVNYKELKGNLCQTCLDKVLSALEYAKWKVEDKEPIPLCMVDFETLDIYSIQDTSCKYSVRDYWIVISHKGDTVIVEAYELPYDE